MSQMDNRENEQNKDKREYVLTGEREADVVVVGAAILDIPAGPVDASVFGSGSHPVEAIRMHTGGDALNESIILARMGKRVHLISRVGEDMAGRFIVEQCRREGIDVSGIKQIPGLDTGINLVLISPDGERSFVTAASGSLRKQKPSDVVISELPKAKILMLASIFVYPEFTVAEMERIFREAKAAGYLVCADMTKCKHNETLEEIAPALCYVDVIFPNLEEAQKVSGLEEPDEIAEAFLKAGVGTIALKLGSRGCLIRTDRENTSKGGAYWRHETEDRWEIPAVPGITPVDTTGAGDTFAAAFLTGLLEEKTLAECGRMANAAASVTISEFGATTALKDRDQINALLSVKD